MLCSIENEHKFLNAFTLIVENQMLSSFANLEMPKYRLRYQVHQKEGEIIHYIKVSLSITENDQRINEANDKKKKYKWLVKHLKKMYNLNNN